MPFLNLSQIKKKIYLVPVYLREVSFCATLTVLLSYSYVVACPPSLARRRWEFVRVVTKKKEISYWCWIADIYPIYLPKKCRYYCRYCCIAVSPTFARPANARVGCTQHMDVWKKCRYYCRYCCIAVYIHIYRSPSVARPPSLARQRSCWLYTAYRCIEKM